MTSPIRELSELHDREAFVQIEEFLGRPQDGLLKDARQGSERHRSLSRRLTLGPGHDEEFPTRRPVPAQAQDQRAFAG